MKKLVGLLMVSLISLVFSTILLVTSAGAVEIKQVESKSGVTALLVEDYTLPLISLSFSFGGGTTQDPPGKMGTVRLLSTLMDEGAGDLDSSTFRQKLEELGIEFGFSSSAEYIAGGIRSLRSQRDNAFKMLALAMNEPRFDDEAIERMRDAIRTGIIRSRTNPGSVAAKKLRETLFGDHPYALPPSGDEKTISAITRDDIVSMHKKLFAREKLVIGVVGAISEEELAIALDDVFAKLPHKSGIVSSERTEPLLGENVSLEMPVPNSRVTLVYKGLKRDHPDFFAAHLMNYILGGSSFSSRLYLEIREKRGLAYGVSSGLGTFKNAAYLSAGTSTRAENLDEAVAVMKSEIAKLAEHGVTEAELEAAKKYIIGSYAINNLDTSGKIARVLVAIQTEDLGIDYIDRRREKIDGVKLSDVNRVAKELLSVEPTVVIVGPATQ